MTATHIEIKTHPTEVELADFLDKALSPEDKARVERHLVTCDECLTKVVSAYEAVRMPGAAGSAKKGKGAIMKKINLYLVLAVISFILSFAVSRYFVQFLAAAMLLGIKWIVDSKSTKMLIMIYEAWKKGGEKEASRIIEQLDADTKKRF